MKKILTIKTVDDRVIERDITLDKGFPFGAKANDISYATLCQTIGQVGYTDIERTDENTYTHIPPSQIKSVSFRLDHDKDK